MFTPPPPRHCLALAAALSLPGAFAQNAPDKTDLRSSDTVVVTGSRISTPALRLPAAVDVQSADSSALSQPGVNASETLGGIPGLNVNNRQNFAQDLQVSIRGFGARSTFGVRGVRVLQDGIPLTMPDGQGQTGTLDLDSADHWEVLRGPLAVMYGNSAGGVIQLFSDFSRGDTHGRMNTALGSFGLAKLGFAAKADVGEGVMSGNAGFLQSDGYRQHSAATRNTLNLRGRWPLSEGQSLTVVANQLNQPDTQDPLGLTRAQAAADPTQPGNGALQFNTRKSVDHSQLGLVWNNDISSTLGLKLAAYGGRRDILQYLALAGTPPTSSGGVVHLARTFRGLNAQGKAQFGAFTLTAGLDVDEQFEDRYGFVNNNGVSGALRRNESNRASDHDAWLQGQWAVSPVLEAVAGLRRSQVSFRVNDHYITAANPDDSGSKDYAATSGMAGLNWLVAEGLALYASAGRGFETPTLVEFAYRPDGGSGSNLALKAAINDTVEFGAKGHSAQGTFRAALFTTRVKDEIVAGPQIAVGRNTYVNAARTRRDGLELSASHRLGSPVWTARGSLTLLNARFDDFTGSTGANLNGKRLPGTSPRNATAEIAWQPERRGFSAALEWRASGPVWVNDANADAAPGYGLANLRSRYSWLCGTHECAIFARLDNMTDRKYFGSVIVNAANAQYYEPAPGRALTLGFTLRFARD